MIYLSLQVYDLTEPERSNTAAHYTERTNDLIIFRQTNCENLSGKFNTKKALSQFHIHLLTDFYDFFCRCDDF